MMTTSQLNSTRNNNRNRSVGRRRAAEIANTKGGHKSDDIYPHVEQEDGWS